MRRGSTSRAEQIFPTTEQLAVLWQRMADLFPNRWLNQVGTFVDEQGREATAVGAWRTALAGMRGQQLAVGLQALIASGADYPPSAPKFRKLCLADVPSEWTAYREACTAAGGGGMGWESWRWSHPVVYAAAHDVGSWDLAHLDGRVSAQRFVAAYARAVERFAAGEEMTAPVPKRLEKPKRESANPATAEAELAKMRAALFPTTEEPTDGPADPATADGNPAPETAGPA